MYANLDVAWNFSNDMNKKEDWKLERVCNSHSCFIHKKREHTREFWDFRLRHPFFQCFVQFIEFRIPSGDSVTKSIVIHFNHVNCVTVFRLLVRLLDLLPSFDERFDHDDFSSFVSWRLFLFLFSFLDISLLFIKLFSLFHLLERKKVRKRQHFRVRKVSWNGHSTKKNRTNKWSLKIKQKG